MNSPVSQPKRNFSAVRSPKDITSENSISRYAGLPCVPEMSLFRNPKNPVVFLNQDLTCDLFLHVSAGCCSAAGSPGCYVQKCNPKLTTYYSSSPCPSFYSFPNDSYPLTVHPFTFNHLADAFFKATYK